MKANILLCVAVTLLTLASVSNGMDWPALHVTWGPTKETPGAFALMPSTASEAKKAGWNLLNENDCKNGGKFNGFRYIYQNDPEYSLLFDVNGYLAGAQFNALEDELKTTPNTYLFDKVPSYVRNTLSGKTFYTLTAYFVNPDTICTVGRTFWQTWREGVGKELYFQQGPDPSYYYQPPKYRDEAFAMRWSRSACVSKMGFHSYYGLDTVAPTNCSYVYPFVLLYNEDLGTKAELKGFVFMVIGYNGSPRFEHPDLHAVTYTLGKDAVTCMTNIPLSTQYTQIHHFLTPKPWEYQCPIPPAAGGKYTRGVNGNLYRSFGDNILDSFEK